MKIGPAEQAAGEFLESRGYEFCLQFGVDNAIPLALAIWGAEMEAAALAELRKRGLL
jgi:hypothetical protein